MGQNQFAPAIPVDSMDQNHAGRSKRLETVNDCAKKLLQALEAAKRDDDQFLIILEMIRTDERRLPQLERLTERDVLKNQFQEARNFLRKLSAASAACGKIWKQPQYHTNTIARLVLMDIIAIYEWLTDKKATRQVDRDTNKDTGPFWRFAVAIWPMVFGSMEGLSSTMRNWASAVRQKLVGTRSLLIVNIAMRHPTWGVFDRQSLIPPM
jgi:hypothetical protein